MYRLARIIDGYDFESFECECEASDEDSEYEDCCCDHPIIYQEDKLAVALSTDYFHDPIDNNIRKLWERNSKSGHNYELRDVTIQNDGIAGQERAKKNGYTGSYCVCSDIIIKPDGKLRLCGCNNSPVIGDVSSGITEEWERKINDSGGFHNSSCHQDL